MRKVSCIVYNSQNSEMCQTSKGSDVSFVFEYEYRVCNESCSDFVESISVVARRSYSGVERGKMGEGCGGIRTVAKSCAK